MELLDNMVILFLILGRMSILLSIMVVPECAFPPTVHESSFFSTSLPTLVSCVFDFNYSDRCEVISHCGFDLHFSDD